jgi:hypothetical protein
VDGAIFGDCELPCILVLAELVGRLQFQKRSQLFFRVRNETLPQGFHFSNIWSVELIAKDTGENILTCNRSLSQADA